MSITVSVAVTPRPMSLTVVSAQAPQILKDAAVDNPYMYQCDGVDDQVQINAALAAAALQPPAPASYASQGGWGRVELTAGSFDIHTDPCLIDTGVILTGRGMLTELRARAITAGLQSIIGTAHTDTHLWTIRDLWLNGNFSAGQAHGIHLSTVGGGASSRPPSSPDASPWMHNLFISACAGSGERHAIFSEGTSSGARASKLSSIRATGIYGHGLNWAGGSDTHMTDVEVTTDGATAGNPRHGFNLASGNMSLTQCKAFYCDADSDGFYLGSSRATLNGCLAQDNGRHGFNVQGQNTTLTGCVADSNQRLNADGGGFNLASSGHCITGAHCYDRAQSAQRQTHGIRFVGTPSDLYVTGRVSVPSGTNHVTGTYATPGNLVTIARNGITPLHYVG